MMRVVAVLVWWWASKCAAEWRSSSEGNACAHAVSSDLWQRRSGSVAFLPPFRSNPAWGDGTCHDTCFLRKFAALSSSTSILLASSTNDGGGDGLTSLSSKSSSRRKKGQKRRKRSMAEKRKRRGKRLERPEVDRSSFVADDEWNRIPSPTATGESAAASDKDKDTASSVAKAKAVVEAQRASVDTLGHVRKCVEAFPPEVISQLVSPQKHHVVVDDFLQNDSLVQTLCDEARQLWQANQLQLTAVGTGEYEGPITGGAEQYATCPRCVEYVVSMTKHLPPLLQDDNSLPPLSNAASMAFLRTFHRKAYEASLQLLGGGAAPQKEVDALHDKKDLQLLVPDTTVDKRRLTLLYFLTPHGWEHRGGNGGAIVFGSSEAESKVESATVLVEAKRDRLVLFRSDATWHSQIPWRATGEAKANNEEESTTQEEEEESEHASCLILHLVTSE